MHKIKPNSLIALLSLLSIKKSQSILDVGCGNGSLIFELKELGFNKVLGIDPFIPQTLSYNNGLTIQKIKIEEMSDKWDLIMLHHSFEHMPDPLNTLMKVSQLLNDNGYCLIRVPVSDSFAYNHYKENWVQIDAPRHYFTFTNKGIETLANKCNLTVKHVINDSTSFQFWGSEQYIKNIPLFDSTSYAVAPKLSIFSPKKIKEYDRRAVSLNSEGLGDSRAFFLQKKTPLNRS